MCFDKSTWSYVCMFGPFAFHSSQTCTLIISLLSMFGFVSFDISFSISCSRPSLLTCRLLKHVCLSACSRSCCCNVRPSAAPSPPSVFAVSSPSSFPHLHQLSNPSRVISNNHQQCLSSMVGFIMLMLREDAPRLQNLPV